MPAGDQTEDQERIEGAVTRPEFTDEDRRRALESLQQTRAEFQRTHDADWYADELGESGRLGYAAGERAGYERARRELGAVGPCGNLSPLLFLREERHRETCTLLAGHDGWHRNDTGMSWGVRDEVEGPSDG
jgi:hypothetical protein